MLKILMMTAAMTAAGAAAALADYPERAIQMIVPWNAGGGSDAIARAVAAGLEQELGVAVSVVNRSGGAGVVGHNEILRAAPDGYTVGFGTAELATYYWTGNAEFKGTDFTPVALVNFDPGAFFVNARSDWADANAGLEAIRAADAGTYKMSGTAIGAAYHLAFAQFLKGHGIDPLKVTMIPSQGAAPGFQELAAGGVEIIPSSLPEGATMMQAGQAKALAVFSADRNPAYPDVPTAQEATGVANIAGTWRGVVGPTGMDEAAAARLAEATQKVVESEDFRAFMDKQGYGIRLLPQADFAAFLTEQTDNFGAIMKDLQLSTRD